MDQDQRQRTLENFKVVPGVYIGALMSPTEVAAATKSRPQPIQQALHRWTVCGDVWPDLFEMLREGLSMHGGYERVATFSSPSGLHYAVLTHQVGSYQHRYLLPLFDGKVAKCIDDVARDGRLGYSLAGEDVEAVVWGSAMCPNDFVPLRKLCKAVSAGQEEAALEEYAELVRQVREPERIPSLIEGASVQYAGVSAVAPHDLVETLLRRYSPSSSPS